MITVSDDFKKSIKNRNRQIKGYVEILYDYSNIIGELGGSGMQLSPAPIVNDNDVLEGNRIVDNYASLENDYFLLDGSFVLPNDPNIYQNNNTGYISNYVWNDEYFKDIKWFRIKGISNEDVNSMTIYFKDNIPRSVTIEINYGIDPDYKVLKMKQENNTKDFLHFEFENISNINFINVYVDNFYYEDRRIRIPKIDFGMTGIYQNKDLINFKIDESISEFNTETPINECEVVLNNYEKEFDYINPKGLVRYMNNNVKINPYIGVVTEENGIEYVSMGKYYLSDWNNNSDMTTTINGKNLFYSLSNKNGYFRGIQGLWDSESYFNSVCSENGIKNYLYNLSTSNEYIVDWNLPICSILSQLNNYAIFVNGIIQCKRDETVVIENIKKDFIDKLTLSEMLNYPEYQVKDKLKNIIFKVSNPSISSSEASVIFDGNVTTDKENNFVIEFSQGTSVMVEFSPDTYVKDYILTDYFFNSADREGSYNLKLTSAGTVSNNIRNIELLNENYGSEITIDDCYFTDDLPEDFLTVNSAVQNTFDYIKNNYTNYNVTISYNGNPAYETNDVLNIETPFGNKNVRIIRQTFTFDGSLKGTIEGVGN